MISAERRKQILELVEKRSSISVAEMCELLDVSEMTIRRDLSMLSNQGLLQRVHGGAVSRRGRSYEPPYLMRSSINVNDKHAIGEIASSLVMDGDSLALDNGSTVLELAKSLAGKRNLTVLTASLAVANVLADAPGIRLILSGGILRPEEGSLIGHIAERTFQEFRIDKAFIGVGGISLENGLTEYNLEDTLVKRNLINNAEQIIVLTDSSKLGKTRFSFVAPLSVVDVLITDNRGTDEVLQGFRNQGIEVLTTISQENNLSEVTDQ
jgi:DeoR family transcriptional regulator, fructose operon transcriptional repressor